MYNPEEDIIPYELLEQALIASRVTSTTYNVYYSKDTGDILSITNEIRTDLSNSFEVEYDVVKEFFNGKKSSSNYKVIFVDQTTPAIISKNETDVNLSFIDKVANVNHWDSMFTIENYPLLKNWGFQIRNDQREILKKYNLNTILEIYVVDNCNMNFIYRTIKVSINDLVNTERKIENYQTDKEGDVANISVYVKKFFSSVGYQILYDTNS